MRKTYLFFLLIAVSVGILAKSSFAQTQICAVKLSVKSEEGILVKDAIATAKSYETKKLYEATLKNGIPFFLSYRRAVTKSR